MVAGRPASTSWTSCSSKGDPEIPLRCERTFAECGEMAVEVEVGELGGVGRSGRCAGRCRSRGARWWIALTSLVVGLQRERARWGWWRPGCWGCGMGARCGRRMGRSRRRPVARETNSSKASAGVEITRARGLRDLPVTARAVSGGGLSLDHVDLLAGPTVGGHEGLFASARKRSWCEQCRRVAVPAGGAGGRRSALVTPTTRSVDPAIVRAAEPVDLDLVRRSGRWTGPWRCRAVSARSTGRSRGRRARDRLGT